MHVARVTAARAALSDMFSSGRTKDLWISVAAIDMNNSVLSKLAISFFVLQRSAPQGTLDMLIFKIVALGPVDGYGISQGIRQISKEVLQVQQGSL